MPVCNTDYTVTFPCDGRYRDDVQVKLRWLPLLALVLAACGSRAGDVEVASEATTTTSTSAATTTSTTGEPVTTTTTEPSPAISATATTAGIEVALTVEHDAVAAGSRLWADLVITNVGDETVYWQAGGCGTPGSISLVAPDDMPATGDAAGWNGDGATFPRWARDHNALHALRFVEQGSVGWSAIACTADSHMKAFAPGDRLDQRAAVDIRVAPGVETATYEALGAFRTYADPEDYGYEETDHPREPATVSVPITVRAAGADVDAAIDAFAGANALRSFVERTRTASVENTWTLTLAWWNGAWELQVNPYYSENGTQMLRLRYDPAEAAIVDARVVWDGLPPEDDPDAVRHDGAKPDEKLS
jgi:hypothetical protein